ncbi:MAG TPA: PCRF domain-containing protein, partial [Trueperaceae bacterium]|nr:PCRF domain-containing protein [Trueperaceae bacterium]
MTERIQPLMYELETLERSLSDPAILADGTEYRRVLKRYGEVKGIVDAASDVARLEGQLAGLSELLTDPELRSEAEDEAERLEQSVAKRRAELAELLTPR